MSQPKVLGAVTAGAATGVSLPVTGSPVVPMVAAGIAFVIGGLLLMRASRYRRHGA
jgi:LPXTG-motif cell wall-anchored protein